MQSAVERAHRDRDFARYAAALDAGLHEKLGAIAPWIEPRPGCNIVDIGAGTGALAARQARLHAACPVIGVDISCGMVEHARSRFASRRNLEFRIGDARDVHTDRAASVVFCSVLHEVYSYAGDSLPAVGEALASAWQSLLPGGRVVVRDFVSPEDGERAVLLRQQRADVVAGHDFVSFAREFRRPVTLRGVRATARSFDFETDLKSACEYMLRKDYHAMWDAELHERYGFWTATEALRIVQAAGFRIVHTAKLSNSWLAETAWNGRVELRDPTSLAPLAFPACQLLLVGEKPSCQH